MQVVKKLEAALLSNEPLPNIIAAAEELMGCLPEDGVTDLNRYLDGILSALEKGRLVAVRRIISDKMLPLARVIAAVTDAEITEKIKAQYTSYMYPDTWGGIIPQDIRAVRVEAFHNIDMAQHLAFPSFIEHASLEVLNAGCGTGESLILSALSFPQARFTAVDISENSLGRAKGYAEKLNIHNIEFVQADLMSLDLGRQFDIIQSSGVIHHLANPKVGLEKLKQHLKPEGAMVIFVYAKYGRLEIELFRDAVAVLQNDGQLMIGPSEAKRLFESLNKNSRTKDLVLKEDIKKGDQHIVDLLLNANEYRYTIKEFNEVVEEAGLQIVNLLGQYTYDPLSYTDSGLVKSRLATLSLIDRAYLAELLSGKMTKHAAVITHRDNFPAMPHCSDGFPAGYFPHQSPYIIMEKRGGLYYLMLDYKLLVETCESITATRTGLDKRSYEIFSLFDGTRSLGDIQEESGVNPQSYWELVNLLVDRKLIYLHC